MFYICLMNTETQPITKPVTKPVTKPDIDPYSPSPGVNPNPKA